MDLHALTDHRQVADTPPIMELRKKKKMYLHALTDHRQVADTSLQPYCVSLQP
jgi:hypothetical protein